MTEVIWLGDDPKSSYHDIERCRCLGHCQNCWEDLATVRRVRDQMIAEGRIPPSDRLSTRALYCSPYCKNRAKRERAFDRALAAFTVKEES
jgi:hypothetical protein